MAIANIYHKRFVLFMDILGFKELVRSGREQQIFVALDASKNLANRTSDEDFCSFKSAVFSDCIVMSQVFDDKIVGHSENKQFQIS
ncbi:hypothetical protein [uncultured Sphaerotilus sp.]|uniref:hypothetical protein n=1 Tax=uncultured Sphaerotilus sp. TaxID=474984 RepID=UPI0030CA4AEE